MSPKPGGGLVTRLDRLRRPPNASGPLAFAVTHARDGLNAMADTNGNDINGNGNGNGTRLDTLARLALGEASTEATAGVKARALLQLVGAGEDSPVDRERLRAELEAIVAGDPATARGAQATFTALRALEALERPSGWAWPSLTPHLAAPENYWPYDTTPARHGQEGFRELDADATRGERDRWRERVEGPPPWKHAPA